MLTASPGLAPFDPTLPLVIATDASQNGIGGVPLQNDQPILYVARALTPAEKRYAIIEKELLAVVFVLTRCHFYTYGRPVTVKTNHKPLLGLVQADAERLLLRIRHFVERLFPYTLTWEYLPGKENIFPDALSRLDFRVPVTVHEIQHAQQVHAANQTLHDSLLVGGPLFQDIYAAAAHGVQFQALLKCAAHGWQPKLIKRDARRHLIQPYWPIRHELRVLGQFLMWGDRVCVSRSLQARALTLLHQGHPGISFMHQRAKNIFYWPGMTADTHRFVASCDACTSVRPAPPREPLLQEPPAAYPGKRVAAEFFDLGNETYLVACDQFSNFPFYAKVSSPTASALIAALRTIFLQTGFPRVFLSDGGPAFRSASVQAFLKLGSCLHRVSSPRYAQSNGAAERVVQTIKALKQKVSTPDDLFLAVLQLQNTPRPDTELSPSAIFFGRTQRTPLFPQVRQTSSQWPQYRLALQRRQQLQARYYNQHACDRSPLTWYPGQRAQLRDPDVLPQIVEILGPAPQPRAYVVRLTSGTVTTRNQKYLFLLRRPDLPPAESSRPPSTQARSVTSPTATVCQRLAEARPFPLRATPRRLATVSEGPPWPPSGPAYRSLQRQQSAARAPGSPI